jgi:hypothetical protein
MKYSDSRKIMSDIGKAWSRRERIGVGVAGFGTLGRGVGLPQHQKTFVSSRSLIWSFFAGVCHSFQMPDIVQNA